MVFLTDVWGLLRPFLSGPQRWINSLILLCILGLVIAGVQVSVLLNKWNATFYNALQDRDMAAFYDQIVLWVGLFAASLTCGVVQLYLRRTAHLRWRRVLTDVYLRDWLSGRAYYRLQVTAPETDNPDQRIADDLDQFSTRTINLLFDFISAVLKLGAFVSILWAISGSFTIGGHVIPGYMFWIAMVYALIANWLAHLVGRTLAGLNFRHQRFEADFRYGLVRVRDNAQGIALYGGEGEEQRHLADRFGQVVHNLQVIIRRETFLSAFVSGHAQITTILSYLVATPHYFAGIISLGVLMQTASAFMQTEVALSWLVRSYRSLAEWKATFDRLRQFRRAVDAFHRQAAVGSETQAVSSLPGVQQLTLRRPDGALLLRDLTLHFPPGSRTLLTGPSGCGKSTLFNALAGLWPHFDGVVTAPGAGRLLFLPQRAYLPVTTLRRAVCYPDAAERYAEAEIRAALDLCGLSGLTERLEEAQDWGARLSPGEQQRLAFARAVLIRPDMLFLDEATSSLDEPTEADLYSRLMQALPDAAIISIAHRSGVRVFHARHVDLTAHAPDRFPMLFAPLPRTP